MKEQLEHIIAQMTLEEKAKLCSGQGFWYTKPIERLSVPSIMMTDGPHGLRKEANSSGQLGVHQSEPATCFPTAVSTSCSWDRDLLFEVGAAIGAEARQERVSIVLGPGANIKRSPLCGRNFEYFSEDPLVAGELAAAMIQGIQSQGVGTSMKHYACNNQETARMINDSIVDPRALREIYLTAFEIAIKKAQPTTLMCAYNKLNGTYACENQALLTDIPRGEWGFQGAIMTDWGAMDDRVWALKAGLDLEMPYPGPHNDQKLIDAVKDGKLDEAVLDRAVLRLLTLIESQIHNPRMGQPYDVTAHDALARRVATESAVLLKNDGILPLKPGIKLAVIGEFAQNPRYQGAGSSRINPHKITSALETLDKEGIPYTYARGYDLKGKADAAALRQEAVDSARGKDVVLVFAGLPDEYESEGFDRTHIDLPQEHNALIAQLAAVNPNIIVVLHAGSAVRLPWIDQVKGVLYLGLGGQCVGAAAVDLLSGRVNPSGKLTETFPLELSDVPAQKQFGKRHITQYRESIYVGYRYFDTAKKAVRFPFGFGLSYTQFTYSGLNLSTVSLSDDEALTVSLRVRNIGERAGKEVVQLYVAAPQSRIFKPVKELRAFAKVSLAPGEEKEVSLSLSKRAFAYYNVQLRDWHVESGEYQILVGSSSRDIHLSASVQVWSSQPNVEIPDYRQNAPAYYDLSGGSLDVPQTQFEAVYGDRVPSDETYHATPYTLNSSLADANHTLMGKYLKKTFQKKMREMTGGDETQDETTQRMMEAMIFDMPLRSLTMSGMSITMIEGMVDLLNGKIFNGLGKLLKAKKASV